MKASDVFTPNSIPTVTLVDDHLRANKQIVLDELEKGSSLISLIGPSKSGKTVFIENIIGKDDIISVSGAGVDSPDKLWNRVMAIIGTPVEKKKSFSSTHALGGGLKGAVGVELPVKSTGEFSASYNYQSTSGGSEGFALDYMAIIKSELGSTDFVIFIDDFHYISKSVQSEIGKQIKDLIQNKVKIICASVPYRSEDVLRANPDLRGRFLKIDFDYWNNAELAKIPILGFKELKLVVSADIMAKLAIECFGSPQLMQSLCLNFCFEIGHRETGEKDTEFPMVEQMRAFEMACQRTLSSNDYSSLLKKLIEGPKVRGSPRAAYSLKSGEVMDVYPIIVRALAQDPPRTNIRYPELNSRIQSICGDSFPSGSSVTGACEHISDIANSADDKIIIDWDGEYDVMDIRDPYFMFYMRWNEKNK